MPGFHNDSSLSVVEHELFGTIRRHRKMCVTARCANVEDECRLHTMLYLTVPSGAKHVKLRDLWDESLKPVRRESQRVCCRACGGHDEQEMIDQEAPFLFITLVRRKLGETTKRDAAVKFPRYIEWTQSGSYECVSVLHHHGAGTEESGGHYTATCKTSAQGPHVVPYHHFDDDAVPVAQKWRFLEERPQQKSAVALLYARVDLRTGARMDSVDAFPFKVGGETRQFLESVRGR